MHRVALGDGVDREISDAFVIEREIAYLHFGVDGGSFRRA